MSATTTPIIIREGFNKLWINQVHDENKTNYALKQHWTHLNNNIVHRCLVRYKKERQLITNNMNYFFFEFPKTQLSQNNFIIETWLQLIRIQRTIKNWKWFEYRIYQRMLIYKLFLGKIIFQFFLSKLITFSALIYINKLSNFLFQPYLTLYNTHSPRAEKGIHKNPIIWANMKRSLRGSNKLSTLRIFRIIRIFNLFQNLYVLAKQFAFEIERLVSERHIHIFYILRDTLRTVKILFGKNFDKDKKDLIKKFTTPRLGLFRLNLLGRTNKRTRTRKIEILEPDTVGVHKTSDRINYQHVSSLARIGVFGSRFWSKT